MNLTMSPVEDNDKMKNMVSKKVGVTTIHRLLNYGSVLQTYALQNRIAQLGYDCEVIDYVYPNKYHLELDSVNKGNASVFRSVLSKMARYLTSHNKKVKAFAAFRSEHIKHSAVEYRTLESLHNSPPGYDVFVTGSDQVWNPAYMHGDMTFLLDFAQNNAKRIAYAASFGNSDFDQRYAELYKKHLLAFSDISVREWSGIDIVADLTGASARRVLDPTLLLTAEDWVRLAVKPRHKNKYILCYLLEYSFNPQPYADNLAKQLQELTGYDVVFLKPPIRKLFDPKVRCAFAAGPREFLGWFAEAEFILTTSFHGTAFSVNFNKPFLSIVNDGATRDCRQYSLLEQLGLLNQIIPKNSPLPDLDGLQLNYGVVNRKLECARRESLAFLSNALES